MGERDDDATGVTAEAAPRPWRDRAKWLGFRAVLVLLVLAVIEGAAWISLRLLDPSGLTDADAESPPGVTELERLADPGYRRLQGMGPDFDEVLHPYIGYVRTASDPTRQDPSDLGWQQPVLYQRSPDTLLVAITGASVARQLYDLGTATLREELAKAPRFHGKEIIFVGLCLGGYKQPQQLMMLEYLLTLGGQFDVIINLDGFNEVALHEAENGPKGVFPIFPRWWQDRVNDVPNPEMRAIAGELAYLRRQLRDVESSPTLRRFSRLQTGKLWRAYRITKLNDDISRVVAAATRPEAGTATNYVASGPRWGFSEDALYEHLAQIWSRASRQMHLASRANGIEYYHFLQPNQYVEGSKPMGDVELMRAFQPRVRYRPGVVKGYPKLIAAGRQLREGGVAYTDLTQLFAEEQAPVYSDTCCHFLPKGVTALAQAIARVVVTGDEAR